MSHSDDRSLSPVGDSPCPPQPWLRWYGWTDRGKVRKNNEDSFLGLQFDARELFVLGRLGESANANVDFVFAVSDGLGGANAGEFASRIAVERIGKLLPKSFKQSALGMESGFEDVLIELYEQIHRSINFLGHSYEECSGMGATLSMCWITPGWLRFAHVGDSRIYYLPGPRAENRTMRQVTQDDTYVGWLFRKGQINERQARDHPRRNSLQKALGAGHQFVTPQVGAVAYEPGDRFFLCTDGVVDGLYDAQIFEYLTDPGLAAAVGNPAQRLVNASLDRSGRDNTTAMVVEILDC